MNSKHHFEDQLTAYSLGQLSEEHLRKLEVHLRHCPQCRAHLRELCTLANLLPLTVEPLEPSPEAKRQLFARIEADLTQPSGSGAGEPPAPPPKRLRISLPALELSFATLAILILVTTWTWPALDRQQTMAAIFNSPDKQTRTLSGTSDAPRAQGELVARPGDTRAVLEISGLQPLPADKTYEFWLIRGSESVPAGLFDVDAQGRARLLVSAANMISSYEKLGVTIEPHAGEKKATGPLVAQYGF